ncbi:hypothetical protein CDD82_4179 [Ophiocordyceps australis]|uniref:Uncharacterized protein n=1 Tax=Ophiocordyceps australis TaxID=1399860 RepID=A0A2C5ZUD8_9HYPO|nr:hypothetical protein CDD82_4179 [Ophiocordyceps australis]
MEEISSVVRPRPVTMVEDIISIMEQAEQRRVGPTPAHDSEAQYNAYYAASLMISEPSSQRRFRSEPFEASSDSSDATPQSSLFDLNDCETNTTISASTSDPPQYVLETVPAVPQPLPVADPNPPCLPCDFVALSSCRQRFRLSEVDDWINHINGHLESHLPCKAICWFCDDPEFVASSKGPPEHRIDVFRSRMQHIAQHFRDGKTAAQVRPDYHFLDHVRACGLISHEAFESATQRDDDLPLPRGMILVPHPRSQNAERRRQHRPRGRAPSPRGRRMH